MRAIIIIIIDVLVVAAKKQTKRYNQVDPDPFIPKISRDVVSLSLFRLLKLSLTHSHIQTDRRTSAQTDEQTYARLKCVS